MTVGTDHHPFERLVEWVERWLEDGGTGASPSAFIQTGTTPAPRLAEHRPYLSYPQMRAHMSEASVIVSHGGPGSITMSLEFGKRPVVVPRRRALGEHVDDHQVAFARRIAERGDVLLAETEDRFRVLLDEAVRHPAAMLLETSEPEGDQAVRLFADRVERLLAERSRTRRTRP